MLVNEMIKAISNKELKISELATKYGFSDRTIQSKIKRLGFEWDAKQAKYKFVGTDKSVFNLSIDEVFITKKRSIISGESKPEKKGEVNSKRAIKKSIEKTIVGDADNIDLLLAGKKEKKEYRGFYLAADVTSIIDNVDNGIKSELVNECLRKVFKDKGLL